MKNLYSIPKEKILERLRFENPWWKSGSIDPELNEMSRRLYFDLFMPHILDKSVKRAIILVESWQNRHDASRNSSAIAKGYFIRKDKFYWY